MDRTEQRRLCKLAQILIATKRWEGCGGLVLSEEHKVILAAIACTPVLELGLAPYAKVRSILVHPGTFCLPAGSVEVGSYVSSASTPRCSGALVHHGTTVVLSWTHAARQRFYGRNVVVHEFAHVIDGLDGAVDGIPPTTTDPEWHRWQDALERELERVRCLDTQPPVFDDYAGTDRAELFAVATERFFECPKLVERHHPELYELLACFFRLDPVQWHLTGEQRADRGRRFSARLAARDRRLREEHRVRPRFAELRPLLAFLLVFSAFVALFMAVFKLCGVDPRDVAPHRQLFHHGPQLERG